MGMNNHSNIQAMATTRDLDQEVAEFLADMDGWSFSHEPADPNSRASSSFPSFNTHNTTHFASLTAAPPIPTNTSSSSSIILGFDQAQTHLPTAHISSAAVVWPDGHQDSPVNLGEATFPPNPSLSFTPTSTLNPFPPVSGSQNESRAFTTGPSATMSTGTVNFYRPGQNHDLLPATRATNSSTGAQAAAQAVVRRPRKRLLFLEPLDASAFNSASTSSSSSEEEPCQYPLQQHHHHKRVLFTPTRRGRPLLNRMGAATERHSRNHSHSHSRRTSTSPWTSSSSSFSSSPSWLGPSKFFFLTTESGPPVKKDGRSNNCVKMLKRCTMQSKGS